MRGDVKNYDSSADALQGQDVVVSTVGKEPVFRRDSEGITIEKYWKNTLNYSANPITRVIYENRRAGMDGSEEFLRLGLDC